MRKRGREYTDSWCRSCRRTHRNEYGRGQGKTVIQTYRVTKRDHILSTATDRRLVRKQMLDKMKSGQCQDCGQTFPPVCMDFDHVRGVKRQGLSRLHGYSAEAILAEVSKCDLVCANCHRKRTAVQTKPSPKFAEFHRRIAELKSEPCTDCGLSFSPIAMDFDHVRGAKFRPIASMREFSWAKILDEIAKCDLVCACCHRLRTATRSEKEAA